MPDQATNLRELAEAAGPGKSSAAPGPAIVVVAGARAGVGTTTVAMNLAAAMAAGGIRVVLVESGNQPADLLQKAGVHPPVGRSLADVLAGRCTALSALAPGPAGMLLLTDGRAANSTADDSRKAQQRLLSELNSLRGEADIIIVDAGHGMTPRMRRFWCRARLVILVTTPDDLALMDAYASIKNSASDPRDSDVRLLVNQCDSQGVAAELHGRLSAACQRFLSRPVSALPHLPRHELVGGASRRLTPRVWEDPNSPFGHAVLWLARAVSELTVDASSSGGNEYRLAECAAACGAANEVTLGAALLAVNRCDS